MSNPATICLSAAYALVLLGGVYSIASHHQIVHQYSKYLRLLEAALILPLFFQPIMRQRAWWGFMAAIVLTVLLSYVHFYIWPFGHLVRAEAGTGPSLGPASAFKDWIIQSYLLSVGLAWCLFEAGQQQGWRRWLLIALSAAIVFDNLAMSRGRAGYLLTMAVLLYWAILQLKWRALLGFVLAMVLGVCVLYQFSPTMQLRLHDAWANAAQYQHASIKKAKHTSAFGQEDNSASYRMEMLKRGVWLYHQRPWLGFGTAAYIKANTIYEHQHVAAVKFPFNSSNTIYLDVMVAYGRVGLMLLVAFIVTLWLFEASLSDRERFMMRALLLILIIGGCFNAWFSDSTPAHTFAVLTALCYGSYQRRLKS